MSKEKNHLTAAEETRLQEFEAMSERMIADGYRRVTLTISIAKANLFHRSNEAGF